MRSAAATIFALTLVATFAATLVRDEGSAHAEGSVWSKRRPNRDGPTPTTAPRAGTYKCFTIAMGASMVTPYGAAPTTTPMPSAIDRLQLDEAGDYEHASGKGHYEYDAASGRLIFDSGPLKGWTTRSETDGTKRWLRFAAKPGSNLAPTSRIGDHICSLT